jgi:uncharacterized membrane protein YbhN (UPF0104 family)
VMRAVGIDSWPAAMLLMVVLMVGVALPPSIAALGIFEALTVLTLSAFDIDGNTSLAVGLLLHMVIFVPPAIVGALLIIWDNRPGHSVQTAPLNR